MSIYVKTPKGIEEVERKAHGLALKPRQVLIMIDGKRDREALQTIFPPEMVPAILQELLDGGFIRELAPAPPPPPPAAPKVDTLKAQKEEISAALYEVFGPDADNFTAKIDQAKGANDLAELVAKYEEVVAKMGGRKKAEGFAARVRKAGLDFVSLLAAGPATQTPAAAKFDLRKAQEAMTQALFEAFGPDADAFTAKVDAAKSADELGALGRKYAEVVAGIGGRKKAELFASRLRAAGIPVPDAPAAEPAAAGAPGSAPAVPKPKDDAERLDLARNFMINTANTFTGVVGSSLVVQIEQAKDLRELRALYYDWREALQLSAAGKQRLPDLEQRLAALLS